MNEIDDDYEGNWEYLLPNRLYPDFPEADYSPRYHPVAGGGDLTVERFANCLQKRNFSSPR